MTSQLILFVCTHNKGRSQIANAFFNQLADPDKARSISAGLDPVAQVQPEVIEVMREVDIDLSAVRPIELTGRMLTELNFLVTLGCAERCPTIPPARRQDWRLRDPSNLSVDEVRAIRDEIRGLVSALVQEKGWARGARSHFVKHGAVAQGSLAGADEALCRLFAKEAAHLGARIRRGALADHRVLPFSDAKLEPSAPLANSPAPAIGMTELDPAADSRLEALL